MAIASFVFCSVNSDIPCPYVIGATSEEEAISGSNAATTAAATATQTFCEVTVDTASYVSFGTAPNAGTDSVRFFMPANATRYFRVQSGYKGAVIAA
jgi:hypothetical protein